MSLSTLKQRLREYGLRRRNLEIDEQMIKNLTVIETNGPGELRGYRAMWHALRIKHHIHVPRREVKRIMGSSPTYMNMASDWLLFKDTYFELYINYKCMFILTIEERKGK